VVRSPIDSSTPTLTGNLNDHPIYVYLVQFVNNLRDYFLKKTHRKIIVRICILYTYIFSIIFFFIFSFKNI
jgi:hypothetical protein